MDIEDVYERIGIDDMQVKAGYDKAISSNTTNTSSHTYPPSPFPTSNPQPSIPPNPNLIPLLTLILLILNHLHFPHSKYSL